MPKPTAFIAQKELQNQLRQSTEDEVKTYHKLQRRLKRDKLNVKFLIRRIKQSNEVLVGAGQEPVSLDPPPESEGGDEDDEEEQIPVKKGLLKRAWDKVPNLAEYTRMERTTPKEEGE